MGPAHYRVMTRFLLAVGRRQLIQDFLNYARRLTVGLRNILVSSVINLWNRLSCRNRRRLMFSNLLAVGLDSLALDRLRRLLLRLLCLQVQLDQLPFIVLWVDHLSLIVAIASLILGLLVLQQMLIQQEQHVKRLGQLLQLVENRVQATQVPVVQQQGQVVVVLVSLVAAECRPRR